MTTFYLISAERKELDTTVNSLHNKQLEGHLFGAKPTSLAPAEGCYKGDTEPSFYVAGVAQGMLIELAKLYSQECILKVDGETRQAFFVYPDGSEVYEGLFVPIDKSELGSVEGYTKIGDVYFTIR